MNQIKERLLRMTLAFSWEIIWKCLCSYDTDRQMKGSLLNPEFVGVFFKSTSDSEEVH